MGRVAGEEKRLVNVVYAFQNAFDINVADALQAASTPVLETSRFDLDFPFAKFDLTLLVEAAGEQLELILEYDADAWSASSIERYLDILERFAQTIATSAVEESS